MKWKFPLKTSAVLQLTPPNRCFCRKSEMPKEILSLKNSKIKFCISSSVMISKLYNLSMGLTGSTKGGFSFLDIADIFAKILSVTLPTFSFTLSSRPSITVRLQGVIFVHAGIHYLRPLDLLAFLFPVVYPFDPLHRSSSASSLPTEDLFPEQTAYLS